MATFTDCPTCQRKLRVTDELLGRKIRCPTCGNTFDAPDGLPVAELRRAPASTPDEPTEQVAEGEHPCPSCGLWVSPGQARCPRCGEDLENLEEEAAWDRPPVRVRRDSEPDRGSLVLTLGIISLAISPLGCAPVGLGTGIAAWIMGQTDLNKMNNQQMDPRGHGNTHAGMICGIIGTLLHALILLGCMGLIALSLIR